jgi:hypothetical protein
MNIVVRHEKGIDVYKSWNEIKKKTSYKKEEFAQLGTDFVLDTDNESYEIAKDIKMLERVASERVFAKSQMSNIDWAILLILVLQLIQIF